MKIEARSGVPILQGCERGRWTTGLTKLLVTTSKALVTTSEALVTSSKAPVTILIKEGLSFSGGPSPPLFSLFRPAWDLLCLGHVSDIEFGSCCLKVFLSGSSAGCVCCFAFHTEHDHFSYVPGRFILSSTSFERNCNTRAFNFKPHVQIQYPSRNRMPHGLTERSQLHFRNVSIPS